MSPELQTQDSATFDWRETKDSWGKGNIANFVSKETSPGIVGSHSTSSFVKDVTEFTKAFKNSNGNSKKLINNFINAMQQYGITVTVQQ